MLSQGDDDRISLGLMASDHPSSPPGPETFDGTGMIVTIQVDDAWRPALSARRAEGVAIEHGLKRTRRGASVGSWCGIRRTSSSTSSSRSSLRPASRTPTWLPLTESAQRLCSQRQWLRGRTRARRGAHPGEGADRAGRRGDVPRLGRGRLDLPLARAPCARVRVRATHVHHGLRGADADADAAHCAEAFGAEIVHAPPVETEAQLRALRYGLTAGAGFARRGTPPRTRSRLSSTGSCRAARRGGSASDARTASSDRSSRSGGRRRRSTAARTASRGAWTPRTPQRSAG